MDTLSLRIKYRPLKIGWYLSDGDFAGLRKALRLSHTLWGGRFNPIIPVDDLDLGRQLVNVFRVDVLIPVSDDNGVTAFIDQFPYLPNPFFGARLFIQDPSGGVSATVLDLYHPIRRLYEQHFKNMQLPFRASLYEWDDDDPLADVLLATFGGFPPKEDTSTDYRGLIDKYLVAEKVNLTGRGGLPPDSFERRTPNWIGCVNLQRHHSVINSRGTPGFYVGSAADFHDLVHYWNLRATNTDLLFYDPAFGDRLDGLRAGYISALQARPQSSRTFDPQVVAWSRREDDQLELAGFPSNMRRYRVGFGTWNGLKVNVPVMHFGEKSILGAVSSNSGRTAVSFALPENPCFEEGRRRWQHLVASISPGIGFYDDERVTLRLPFLPELNEYYGRSNYFMWNKARVEPEGIGIIIDSWQADLALSALDVTSLVTKIFEVAGMRAQPSQAGLVASRLIQQLSGLQGCRAFKIAGVRDLIDKYKPDQSFTGSAAIQVIGRNDPNTGTPNFSEYQDLFIETRPRTRKLKPGDVFAYLVDHGVFRVGLKLGCPNCHLDFWLSLDDVKTQTKCEYCGQDFNVTSQLRDRDWHYRRSGLFGRNNHQEGGIPVALTLMQLQTVLHHEMLYTTAMEIEPFGAPVQKCETDFVILNQEHFSYEVQIAIGECKNRGEITEDDVAKLRMIAEALEKKGIQIYVVFAKLSDFTSEELARCQAVNGKYERRLILFTARELEPYFIYEKTEEEFDIQGSAISLEDMANTTHAVFYEQRRKPPQEAPSLAGDGSGLAPP